MPVASLACDRVKKDENHLDIIFRVDFLFLFQPKCDLFATSLIRFDTVIMSTYAKNDGLK